MPDLVVAQLPITDAVVAALEDATSHPVGDADAVDFAGDPIDTTGAYTLVTPIPGGAFDGSFGEPHEMAIFRYQVDSYNRNRRGCEWLADRNRAGLLTATFSIDGWKVMHVDQPGVGGVENAGRDDTHTLPLFVCSDDFAVQVTAGPAI